MGDLNRSRVTGQDRNTPKGNPMLRWWAQVVFAGEREMIIDRKSEMTGVSGLLESGLSAKGGRE